ncbi:MAG: T9SS type A sorting domain-containing protein [Bacteroidales bacterium]|nr:T9SS type A sorting domain-containing protein [Bacteroidales bacterium]
MKKISVLLVILSATFSMSVLAQGICSPPCTPDASCEDVLNPGEICPEVLPTANVGIYYDETVTVIPPSQYQGFPIVSAVRIDQVNGLPEGMTWCKSADKFTVTTPATRYCCQITGTPVTPGVYPLTLLITPFIGPVPSSQITDDTSLVVIVLPAPPVAAFSSGWLNTIEIGTNIEFSDESTNSPTAWAWVFEGGNPPTSIEQNPVVNYTTVGVYDVTLTAYNEGGENTIIMSDYLTVVNTPSEINSSLNNNIKIYPNPATHEITVEAANLESITIVDVLGKVVYSQNAASEKEVIDISSLLKANYFIKVKTGEGEITKSITIK